MFPAPEPGAPPPPTTMVMVLPGVSVAEFGDVMYFRTERQTLWKLHESGDILFTIRTYRDSLSSLDRRYPEFRKHLGQTLQTTSAETRRYKGWVPMWESLMAWSDQAI